MLEVDIVMVSLDQTAKTPIVILREKEGKNRRFLPILIGFAEAFAIAIELDNQTVERPMTHDLLKSVIESLGAQVISVLVSDLRDNTFYAELNIRTSSGKVIKVDSRPSDAMALAVRAKVPIYVSEDVMDRSGINPSLMGEDEDEQMRIVLDSLKPDDFDTKV